MVRKISFFILVFFFFLRKISQVWAGNANGRGKLGTVDLPVLGARYLTGENLKVVLKTLNSF